MSQQETVAAVQPNSGLMQFIIGKMWVASKDTKRPGSIKINRSLPANITLGAGDTLFLTENVKRDGKNDADYSVSVLLPKETAQRLIALQNETEANIKAGSVEVE